MKKILSIFLTLALLLSTGAIASAQVWNPTPEAGKIKIKLNIKDYETGKPLPGVNMGLHLHWGTNNSERDYIIIGSGVDGTGWGHIPFNTTSFMALSPVGGPNFDLNQLTFIDMDVYGGSRAATSYVPATPGYGWHTNPQLVAGKVRNLVSGYNAGALNRTTHDDGVLNNLNWKTQGAVLEFDVYLECSNTTHRIFFDVREMTSSSAQNYTEYNVSDGATISAPAVDPVSNAHPTWALKYWTYGGEEFDFANTTIKHNITLKPKWLNPNPATGKVNFEVYLWDHAKAIQDPKTFITNGTVITGTNGGQVFGHYSLTDYQNNQAWTNVPVDGAVFILKCYPDQGLNIPEGDKKPLGQAWFSGWENDPTISRITTGSDGKAFISLTEAQLDYMKANGYVGMRIDTDPVSTIIAHADRGQGTEDVLVDWDWQVVGAGLVGVRNVVEGERHLDSGVHISAYNDNDVVVLTEQMLEEGFEFTFRCYVSGSLSVLFEVGDGTLTNPADATKFPLERIAPLNSMSGDRSKFKATNPGNPTPNDNTKVFAGWYEVKANGTLEDHPFDFNREISNSLILRAQYADRTYTARWANEGWAGTDNTLIEKDDNLQNGTYPTFDGTLPTKASSGNTDYTLAGWKLYTQDNAGTTTFGSTNYTYVKDIPLSSMTHVITDVTMGTDYYKSTDAISSADQVYVAYYDATNHTGLTITKSGLSAGESAIFTVTDGASNTFKIVLTATSSSSVSKTIYDLPAGTWTVTEDMNWAWAYNNTSNSQNVTIAAGESKTLNFANTAKTQTPAHAEGSKNNSISY